MSCPTATPTKRDVKGKGKALAAPVPSPPKETSTATPTKRDVKGKGKAVAAPVPSSPEDKPKAPQAKNKPRASPTPKPAPPLVLRTVVMHGAPTKYKPGQMRTWIEEDNETPILGIRWLLKEPRRAGKAASSLVIYLRDGINNCVDNNLGLRMGRKIFRTTPYNWQR